MLHALHITKYSNSESRVKTGLGDTEICSGQMLGIHGFGAEEEYIRSRVFSQQIEVLQDG